jgi:hypothetical protein
MISEESDYLVKSAVSQCINSPKTTTISSSTSSVGTASQDITDMNNQGDSDGINDNVQIYSTTLTSLNGGGNTIYKIIFRNKTFSSNGKSE